ncbi:MAG: hypothetical protein WCV90_08835 [Candidatus Woesearchaeota archaeon]|jgi:hypothetical protein
MSNRFTSLEQSVLRKLALDPLDRDSRESFAKLRTYFPFGDCVSLNGRGVLITGNPGGHGKTTLTECMARRNEDCYVISHDTTPIYADGTGMPLIFPREVEELIFGQGTPLEVIIVLDVNLPVASLSKVGCLPSRDKVIRTFNLDEQLLEPYLKTITRVKHVGVGKPMGGPHEPCFQPVYERVMEYLREDPKSNPFFFYPSRTIPRKSYYFSEFIQSGYF